MGVFSKLLNKGKDMLIEKGKEKLPEVLDEHLSFDHSRAVASKIKDDIKRFALLFDIFVQLFFIGYYIYSVCTHVDALMYLIIYIVLLSLSTLYLLFHLITLRIEHKRFKRIKKRVIKKIFNYIKLFIQALTIGIGIYELATIADATNIKLLMVILTGMLFLINIITKIASNYFERSFDMLEVAMEMDSDKNFILKMAKNSNPFTPEKAGMSDKEIEKYKKSVIKEKEKFFKDK